jgi:alkyl sulfatase BDS1-like metallo-beta-lactamase superfamily hydrolase
VTVANGVMIHEMGVDDNADATLTLPRLALIAMVGGQVKALDLIDQGKLQIAGDPQVLQRFMGLFAPPRAVFPLVTP